MKKFKDYTKSRTSFKKERNPNKGSGSRGWVHIDITAPNEELADKMEEELVELGYSSAEYGDDLGNGGYIFTMVIDSRDLKEFNEDYNKIKNKLK